MFPLELYKVWGAICAYDAHCKTCWSFNHIYGFSVILEGSSNIDRRLCISFFVILTVIVWFREPRGFGFVQFVDPADAADAKYHMDGQILLGREVTVVFAEENRKKPSEMRARDRVR